MNRSIFRNGHRELKRWEVHIDRSCQIADIPGPNLVRCCGAVSGGLSVFSRFLAAAAMVLHLLFTKNTVKAGFGSDISALVSKGRNNLAGRHTGKAFLIDGVQNLLPFVRTQLISRI